MEMMLFAVRMMSRLQAEGYRIPLDIGIASLYNGATLDCFTPAVTAVNILARQQGITIGKQMIHCLKGEIYNKKTMLDYEILLRSQREGRFKMLDYYKGMDISFLQEYLEKRNEDI